MTGQAQAIRLRGRQPDRITDIFLIQRLDVRAARSVARLAGFSFPFLTRFKRVMGIGSEGLGDVFVAQLAGVGADIRRSRLRCQHRREESQAAQTKQSVTGSSHWACTFPMENSELALWHAEQASPSTVVLDNA